MYSNKNETQNSIDLQELSGFFMKDQAFFQHKLTSKLNQFPISSLIDVEKRKNEKNKEVINNRIVKRFDSQKPSIVNGGELKIPSEHPFKLAKLLLNAVKTNGDQGIHFVNSENKPSFLSYKELLLKAQERSCNLKNKDIKKGEIVILQYHENIDFLITFWGLIFIEAIPTPLGVLKDVRAESSDVKRLKNVLDLLNYPKIICDSNHESKLKNLFQIGFFDSNEQKESAILINTDLFNHEGFYEIKEEEINESAITLHLLTSGTTGKPKCVQHSHETLCYHVYMNALVCGLNEKSVYLNWMPLDHVGGIVMSHLVSVYKQCTQIQVDVNLFGAQPLRWLDWIDKYKVTHTWSPNFSFNIISKSILNTESIKNWDLSSIVMIANGGEQVTGPVCHEFLKSLAPFGLKDSVMKPVWGMSETSSMMTVNNSISAINIEGGIQAIIGFNNEDVAIPAEKEDLNIQALVEIGKPFPGVTMRIVNDSMQIVPQGVKGKLQISSPTLMKGYLNNDKANAETFIEEGWMDTGDIAFIIEDKVTISGRDKDMIIINGINYACYDIEEICENIFGVEENWSVACSIPNSADGSDILAVFFVCSGTESHFKSNVIEQIKQKITSQLGIKPELVIPVEKKDIPKTNIGKKQRAAVIKSYLDLAFEEGKSFYNQYNNNKEVIPNWFLESIWKQENLSDISGDYEKVWIYSTQFEGLENENLNVFSHWDDLIDSLKEKDEKKHLIIDFSTRTDELEYDFISIYQSLSINQVALESLIVLTQNRISFDGKEKNNLSGISGLIKTVSHENDYIKKSIQIDVDFFDTDKIISNCKKEFLNKSEENIVIIREGIRYVQRLQILDDEIEKGNLLNIPLPIQKGGLYLITGGLGGVGYQLTEFLAQQYQAKLIITGRKKEIDFQGITLERWESLKKSNAAIRYTNIDFCDHEDIEDFVSFYEILYKQKLNGIFHFAGIIQEILLKDLTKVELDEMYLAKVKGTLTLAKLLDNRNDCLFITTSSARTLKSGMTIGTYSAASDFTENFTLHLNKIGYKAFCFSWSLWDNTGMGKDLAIKHVLASRGYLPMNSDKALISLLVGLKLQKPVLYIGLDRKASEINNFLAAKEEEQILTTLLFSSENNEIEIKEVFEQINVEKDEVVHVLRVKQIPYDQEGKLDKKRIDILLKGEQRPFELPVTQTEIQLAEIWQTILEIESISRLDNFFSLGGDSLKATRLLTCIKEVFQVTIKIEQLFELAELKSLAHIIDGTNQMSFKEDIVALERAYFPYQMPMSLAQKRQWFTYIYAPDSPLYVNTFSLVFYGKINHEALLYSLNKLVERHEGLRTLFSIDENGNLWQNIHKPYEVEIENIDLRNLEINKQNSELFKLRKIESNTTFDLEKDAMLRCKLIFLSEEKSELLFSIHHIVSDGWSAGVFVKDLQELYLSYDKKRDLNLLPLSFQPADFGVWQENNCKIGKYDESISYWKKTLAEVPTVLNFPFDFTRPVNQSYNGKAQIYKLSNSLSNQLKEFSEKRGCTLYMTMMSAFAILLKNYARQEEFVLGSLIANRQNATIEKLIGFFVNTLAIHFDLSQNPNFEEFLQITKKNVLNAWKHQDLPFDRLIDELNIEREAAVHPLFQFLFVQQNAHQQNIDLDKVKAEFIIHDQDATRFDLECHIFDKSDFVEIKIIYNTDLFHCETINQLLEQYETILHSICFNYKKTIDEQNILPLNQKNLILNKWNQPINWDENKTIQEIWYENVGLYKNNIALKGAKGSYSYLWVDHFTNGLASLMQKNGVHSGDYVALLFNRTEELHLSILATVKLGGVYVPIDFEYPEDRLKWMFNDIGNPLIVCSKELHNQALNYSNNVIIVDVLDNFNDFSFDKVKVKNDIDNPLYVNYTSGSTGLPKGIVIPQRGVLRTVVNSGYYNYNSNDNFLQLANPVFDVFVIEIWGAWLNGGKLVACNKEDILDIEKLTTILIEEKITAGFMTVSLFNSLIDIKPESIQSYQCLLVGGEAISVSHIRKALKYVPKGLMNGYGPTENSVLSNVFPIAEVKERQVSIPIGYPLRDSTIYILNERHELVPPGVPGIIFGGGKGVGTGYLNNLELTKEKFLPDNFTGKGSMYNTGDYGRWLPDGSVEYLGRTDGQVKIRGHRIECGEIETAINDYPKIKQAVVDVVIDNLKNKKIAAWVLFQEEKDIEGLQMFLSEQLPGYMIPSYITSIDKIPLNSNGKVDRKKLPQPVIQSLSNHSWIEPVSNEQKVLQKVWSQVLGIDKISIKDSFFELGGDSIMIVQMISKLINKGYRLKPKQVFSFKTIEKLAAVMTPVDVSLKQDQGKITGLVPLNPIQKWFFELNSEKFDYWNLPVLIPIQKVPSKEQLVEIFDLLQAHHDMFRSRYFKDDSGVWTQEVLDEIRTADCEIVTFNFSTDGEFEDLKKEHAIKVQKSLSIEEGKLFKVVVYQKYESEAEIFICTHHLIVDGISWRVIIEDLIALLEDNQYQLPQKTTSFKEYQRILNQYKDKELGKQDTYWNLIEEKIDQWKGLPEIDLSIREKESEGREKSIRLTEEITKYFINQAHSAYKTDPNDLLLSALVKSIYELTAQDEIIVTLEGHGREDIDDSIDISRTVGWFTTAYPIVLKGNLNEPLSKQIRKIKEQLRAIPDKGIGFGLRDSFLKKVFQPICFNYLGRLDNTKQSFEIAAESTGRFHHPDAIRPYPIELNCWINNEVFELKISTPSYTTYYDQLGPIFIKNLTEIINHCIATEEYSYDVTDFNSITLTAQELEVLPMGVKDIYPLTKNQLGMLYQHISYPNARVYFTQIKLEIKGKLDLDILQRSIQQVVDDSDILKSQFIWEKLSQPLQLIHSQVKLELGFHNFIGSPDLNEKIEAFIDNDLDNLFDLSKIATPRFNLLAMNEEESLLVMSFHHILLDGWSLFLVLNAIFDTYHKILQKEDKTFCSTFAFSFKDYLKQLKEMPIDLAFWNKYLKGLEPIESLSLEIKEKGLFDKIKQNSLVINHERALSLKQVALDNGITLNTLIQTAWTLLLSRINGTNDVVYGTTFSGRLPEIEGVQEIVGMLINSLPLRINLRNTYVSVKELAERIQGILLDLQEHQLVELNETYLAANLDPSKRYFDSILVFENYLNEQKENHDAVQMGKIEAYEHTNFPLSVVVIPEEEIIIRVSYQECIYNATKINALLKDLDQIIELIGANINDTIQEVYSSLTATNQLEIDKQKLVEVYTLYEDQEEIYAVLKEGNSKIYILNDSLYFINDYNQIGNIYLSLEDPIASCGEWGEWMEENKIVHPLDKKLFLYPTGDIGMWNDSESIQIIELEDFLE